MREVLLDTVMDSVKLVPFLFLTYFVMEWMEHHTGEKLQKGIRSAGKSGPLWGAVLGIMPQCGFSAAASSLYAGRVITLGTLIAIYLSTSDEMLPIMISEAVGITMILKVLATKAVIGMITGFGIDLAWHLLLKHRDADMDIHKICEQEHCHCQGGVLGSTVKHTLQIFIYIFLISLLINGLIQLVGEHTLTGFFSTVPVLEEFMAGLIGLIPNCASSVVITQLYLQNVISGGAMLSGLLVNAGVGVLVLFRLNKNRKENLAVIGILYAAGVLWGIVAELVGLTF